MRFAALIYMSVGDALLRPLAPGSAAQGGPEAEMSFAARARMGFLIVVASNVAFALTDARLPVDVLRPVLALKVVQLSALALGLLATRLLSSERLLSAVALVVISVVAAMTALSGAVTGDSATTMILFVVTALGGATVLRWSVVEQALLILILVLAMLLNIHLTYGGLAVVTGYTSLGFLLSLGVSLLLANEFSRQRRRLEFENSRRADAEQRVLRSERELRAIFDSMQDILYRIDLQGRIQLVSPSVRQYGWEPDELIGRDAALLYVDPRKRPENVDRLMTYGSLHDHELLLRAKDGSEIPASAHAHLVKDEAGNVVAIEGSLRDISERKEGEAALRRLNDSLDETVRRRTAALEKLQRHTAALLDVARDVAGTLDPEEIMHRVEKRAALVLPGDVVATFAWKEEEKAFCCLSHFGVAEGIRLEELRFAPGEPFDGKLMAGRSVVLKNLAPLGALAAAFPGASLIAAPLQVRGRHLGGLVALRRDGASFDAGQVALAEGIAAHLAVALEVAELHRVVHDQAQISGVLAQVGEDLIASLDRPEVLNRLCRVTVDSLGCASSHTILCSPDEDDAVVVASHGGEDLAESGFQAVPLPRRWVELLLHSGAEPPFQCAASQLEARARAIAESAGIGSLLAVPLLRGKEVAGVQIACFRDEQHVLGEIQRKIARGIGHLGSLALENARAMESVREASRLKSEFVATMSHELRTPLNVVLGYNELLLSHEFGELNEEQAEIIGRSDRSARNLLALINDTLDLGRLEAGRIALERRNVRVSDVVDELEMETRDVRAGSPVRFECNVDATLRPIQTDPAKLKVVLRNLVDNALKFTEQGEIKVTARGIGENVEVRVQDTGIGISAESLGHIFEPFRQVDGSDSRRFGGVGLGLYLVKRLLDLLGGKIEVESEVGVGTTFTVRLPLRPDTATIAA